MLQRYDAVNEVAELRRIDVVAAQVGEEDDRIDLGEEEESGAEEEGRPENYVNGKGDDGHFGGQGSRAGVVSRQHGKSWRIGRRLQLSVAKSER